MLNESCKLQGPRLVMEELTETVESWQDVNGGGGNGMKA